MKKIRASVAMAVYNGEQYLAEQIESILKMLGSEDELIISDDNSKDGTRDIIEHYSCNDSRIRIVENHGKHGVSGNFTNAVMNCAGEYILMSDQDDIWLDNKIDKMIAAIEKAKADLVIHDGRLANENMKPYGSTLFKMLNADVSPMKNFIRGRFLGCCMCFKKETMNYIIPFPEITADFPHDIFATILVGIKGKIVLLDEVLIYHRMHNTNATPKRRNSFFLLLYKRFLLLVCIIKRIIIYSGKRE